MNKKAFTLLELLVALTVTALVVGSVFLAFSSWTRAQDRAEQAMEKLRMRELALTRIRQVLSATYVPFTSSRLQLAVCDGMDLERSGEPFDAITFASLAHRTYRIDAKESDLIEMTLFTKPDPSLENGEQCRILYLREGGVINDSFEVEGGVVYPIAYEVSRFQLYYLTSDGELAQEWKLAERAYQLPCAVIVKLGLGCGENEEDWCLFIPLYLTNSTCEYEQQALEDVCEQAQER